MTTIDMREFANDMLQTMAAAPTLNGPVYKFRGFAIYGYMMPGLRRWIERGELPGEFLQAVLRNDLADACGRADDTNIVNLPAFVAYLYNEAPRECWGSDAKVKAWMERFGTDSGMAAQPGEF